MGTAWIRLCLGLAILPVAGQTGAVTAVTSVRHWSLDGSTRIAIQTSNEARFRVEVLENPSRISIDLDGSEFQSDGKRYATFVVGDRLVKQIRIAQSQPTLVRVVLDLSAPASYEISHLSNPDRLMVEVRPKAVPSASPEPEPRLPAPANLQVDSPPTPQAIAVAKPPSTASVPQQGTKPAKDSSDGSRNLTRALGLKLGRVVIDPGHGGPDWGTTGVTGLREKDLVLDIALRLGALIEEKLGAEVVYTRKDDTFIALEERTAIANRSKADLFLSIHANSSPSPRGYGTETYYLNFTTSKEELDIAARENAGTTKSIYELQDLIRRIALREKTDESREFATRVQSALYGVWSKSGSPARNRGVKKAPFVVLIGAAMPSVLTEVGFLSNSREEAQLKRPEYRKKVAEALYRGVAQYAETLSHFDLARAAGN